MKALFNNLSFILKHPLNRDAPLAALGRVLRWQLGSRLVPGAVAVPFADATRLLVRPGMAGATGNVYCGLHEFEDMAFLLHLLRPGDGFIDVGANVGSYSVLAAGVAGARVVAAEPVPETFAHLLDNLHLNRLSGQVSARNVAVGAAAGSLRFTTGLDTVNHVCGAGEAGVEVPVETLDRLAGEVSPVLIKVDVEGYETEVVKGGREALAAPGLLAVLMEFNGSGARYGYDEAALSEELLGLGFSPCAYRPFERRIEPLAGQGDGAGNLLWIKNIGAARERVAGAPKVRVLGREF